MIILRIKNVTITKFYLICDLICPLKVKYHFLPNKQQYLNLRTRAVLFMYSFNLLQIYFHFIEL